VALLDVSDVVEALGTGSYTVIRRAPGAVDTDGKVLPPVESTVTISAVVLPEPSLADDEQRHMAGGWSTDRIMVFAKPQVGLDTSFTATETGKLADRIIYQGKTYEVTDTLDWEESGGYYQARFGIVDLSVEVGD
jgi:hypothetical protein